MKFSLISTFTSLNMHIYFVFDYDLALTDINIFVKLT